MYDPLTATLADIGRPHREMLPMREDLTTVAPRLHDALDDLCRAMGYSRAWSRVRNDTAAAPVYDWLVAAEVLADVLGEEPRITSYRAHWSELVSMAHAAIRVFGPAVDRHHEAWPAMQAIRAGLAELGEADAPPVFEYPPIPSIRGERNE